MSRGHWGVTLFSGLSILVITLFGCTPEEAVPETDAVEVSTAQPAPVTDTPNHDAAHAETATPETSGQAAPEASAEGTEQEHEHEAAAVDTSIRDAAEFGDDALLEGLAPDGWHQAGAIEHYNVARLYDKINGRSELYMAYDVIGLSWVSVVHDDDPNLFIDVFVYDMRSPTGAFGIYSVEREPNQPKFPLGREGYRTDANHFFWKGKYYAYVQCSLETDAAIETGYAIAQKVADRLEDSREAVQGIELVPTEGLIDDTIQYFRADAMSLDFMTDTFTAHYKVGEMDVTAFMSRRASDAEAADIAAKFAGYLQEYGENVERRDVDGTEVVIGDLGGGYFDGVFYTGSIVAGVSAVESAEATVAAAKAILEKF